MADETAKIGRVRDLKPDAVFDERFKRLLSRAFFQPNKNREIIVRVLEKIVLYVSGGIILTDESQREDAERDVLLKCIEKISNYDRTRNSAFEYFRQVANTEFWAIAADIDLQKSRRDTPATSLDDIWQQPARPEGMAHARRLRHGRSYALLDKRDRKTFSDACAETMDKALAAVRIERQQSADAGKKPDPDFLSRMITAIDTVQAMRFMMLGEFRVVKAPGIEYSKTRRMPREE